MEILKRDRSNHERAMLPGGIRQYATVLIKRGNEEARIAVVKGYSTWQGGHWQVSFLRGGESVVYSREQIVEILDNENFFLDSPVYTVADFYSAYKNKMICPVCKSELIYPSLDLSGSHKCHFCESGTDHYESDWAPFVELTDEFVREHNRKVAKASFISVFLSNYGPDKFQHKTYWDDSSLDFLMDHGKHINKFKDLLTEDDVLELRVIFKECYVRILDAIKAYRAKEKAGN